jgi:hypothetical protein
MKVDDREMTFKKESADWANMVLNEMVITSKQCQRLARKKGNQLFMALVSDASDSHGGGQVCDSRIRQDVLSVVEEFKDVFPEGLPGIPPHREVEHVIELKDDEPVYRPPYRLSPKEQDTLRSQLQTMLRLGLVRPSRSPYGAPVLFVKKRDGSLRMVVDYRALNKKTVKDRYPIPRIADLVDRLGSAKIFSKIDLQQGFYQVRVRESDIHKTAFVTPDGSFELLVMPMGQSNSVATFQRLMMRVFPIQEFGSAEEHADHVRQVLERLRQAHLFVKLSKCCFAMTEVEFLGQIVGNGKRRIDPAKSRAIREYPAPKNATDVRAFLGLVSFCRDFIPELSTHSACLSDLTVKHKPFHWGNSINKRSS